MTADLSGAKCVGRWWLFDSPDRRDHLEARRICQTCPVQLACARELKDVQDSIGRAVTRAGGGPIGTWAGQLFGKSGQHIAERPYQESKRGSKHLPREHGTDRGYYQHRHRRERACDECKAAHLAAYHAKKEEAC